MERIEFTRNAFGTLIKKCCASCEHKKFDGLLRVCAQGEGHVRPESVCSEWKMSGLYEKAGIGGGRVKKKHYLMHVLNYPQPEDLRQHVTLTAIRNEYEKIFGTVYEKL